MHSMAVRKFKIVEIPANSKLEIIEKKNTFNGTQIESFTITEKNI